MMVNTSSIAESGSSCSSSSSSLSCRVLVRYEARFYNCCCCSSIAKVQHGVHVDGMELECFNYAAKVMLFPLLVPSMPPAATCVNAYCRL